MKETYSEYEQLVALRANVNEAMQKDNAILEELDDLTNYRTPRFAIIVDGKMTEFLLGGPQAEGLERFIEHIAGENLYDL